MSAVKHQRSQFVWWADIRHGARADVIIRGAGYDPGIGELSAGIDIPIDCGYCTGLHLYVAIGVNVPQYLAILQSEVAQHRKGAFRQLVVPLLHRKIAADKSVTLDLIDTVSLKVDVSTHDHTPPKTGGKATCLISRPYHLERTGGRKESICDTGGADREHSYLRSVELKIDHVATRTQVIGTGKDIFQAGQSVGPVGSGSELAYGSLDTSLGQVKSLSGRKLVGRGSVIQVGVTERRCT